MEIMMNGKFYLEKSKMRKKGEHVFVNILMLLA